MDGACKWNRPSVKNELYANLLILSTKFILIYPYIEYACCNLKSSSDWALKVQTYK